MGKLIDLSVKLIRKYLPDPFVFAIILTVVAAVAAMVSTGQSPLEVVENWGGGVWSLLAFSMQMALVLVCGSALADAPLVKRALRKMACADEFIQSFPEKYNTHIEQGGTNVSGGQKQRLCIARALLKNPKVLILDDSTSAVDTATDAKIRAAFKTAIPGTTKLIISQRISSIQDADRIIVLDDGRVDGFGTHDELVENNAIYREIYDAQTSGDGDFDEGGDN